MAKGRSRSQKQPSYLPAMYTDGDLTILSKIQGKMGGKCRSTKSIIAEYEDFPVSLPPEGRRRDKAWLKKLERDEDEKPFQLTSLGKRTESLTIPKVYHPFICGPLKQTLRSIVAETGANVNMPPPPIQSDVISITGKPDAVRLAKERIMEIYAKLKQRYKTMKIEVKKPHKFVISPKRFFERTGVCLEMSSLSDPTTETIILRGESDKMARAVELLYQQVPHPIKEATMQVPGWIHQHLLEGNGYRFCERNVADFPSVTVSFQTMKDCIQLSGPSDDVQKAMAIIRALVEEIVANHYKRQKAKVTNGDRITSVVSTERYANKGGRQNKSKAEKRKAKQKQVDDVEICKSKKSTPKKKAKKNGKMPNSVVDSTPLPFRESGDKLTHILIVPKEYHSLIRGNNGSRLAKIQKSTGTKIKLPKLKSTSNTVRITGTCQAINEAIEEIQLISNEATMRV